MWTIMVRFSSLMLVLALLLGVAPVSTASAAGGHGLGAVLRGANEVPGPGDPDARGFALVSLHHARGQVCFFIKVTNVTLPATGAHIHAGAAGVAGPIVVSLTPPNANGVSHGCVTADTSTIDAIELHPSDYYVNVHTSDFPAGAMRGQLFTRSR